MYSDKFNLLIGFVIDHEGREYENDPFDPGGETKYGISKKSYPNENIAGLTEDRAKEIYYNDYWLPMNCDNYNIKEALAIFDSSVNCGTDTVKQWLGVNVVYTDILFKRLRRYANLCQKNEKLNRYLLGWLIRVLHIVELNI